VVEESLNSVIFGHYYLPFYIFCQDCSLWLIIYMTPQTLNFDLYWPYINDPQDPPSYVGGPLRNWPRTGRNGVPLLLPYMPAGIMGLSECE